MNECSICCEVFTNEEQIVLSCSHIVCEECYPTIFIGGKCAMCRQTVKLIECQNKAVPYEGFISEPGEPTDTSDHKLRLELLKTELQWHQKQIGQYERDYQTYLDQCQRVQALAQTGYDPRKFTIKDPLPPSLLSVDLIRELHQIECFPVEQKSMFLEAEEIIAILGKDDSGIFIDWRVRRGPQERTFARDVRTLNQMKIPPEEFSLHNYAIFEDQVMLIQNQAILIQSNGTKLEVIKRVGNFDGDCSVYAIARNVLMMVYDTTFQVLCFETERIIMKGPIPDEDRYILDVRLINDKILFEIGEWNGVKWGNFKISVYH